MRKQIALLILSLSTLSAHSGNSHADVNALYSSTGVARYVNPFIGTAGEGYTYPGAVSPWGMVSASPHTTYTSQLDYLVGNTIAPAGYAYGKPKIDGFGQTHLSGVACNELGAPVIAVSSQALAPGNYASSYSEEVARAGYYSVFLEQANASVEATTTQRVALYKFQFHSKGKNYVLLDASKNLSWMSHAGYIKKLGPQEYGGWSQTGNFCSSGNEQKVYFSIKLLSPAGASGTWQDNGDDINQNTEASGDVGAWFEFTGAGTVTAAIGISYVSMENAAKNLESEVGDNSFETILAANIQQWETQLGKIRVNDPDKGERKTVFYTALYHALLHPNIVSDTNGDYPLYQSAGKGIGNNENYPRYGLFSLWDSYRNVHALLSLFYREQQQAMLYTLEDMSLSAGHPPRWELYGSETNIMVGDPAQSVLAEGIVKGFKFQEPEKLFATLYKSATDVTSDWRPGNASYWEKGFIPEKTDDVWGSVSTTLEYAYNDWALAQFAESIGKLEEAALLHAQSLRWRTLFDGKTGTVRPKRKNGKWLTNFDPATMEDSWWVSLVVKNHGGPGFVEGSAYQYTFMVPHDTEGLLELFGSTKAYTDQLAFIFDNNHFTLWNEPNMAYPYLLGMDEDRQSMMQSIIQNQRRDNFSNVPAGIPGNDDAGVLSAWYVFSILGFYPANPASGDYLIGIPGFQDISLQFPNSQSTLGIKADFDVEMGQWQHIYLD
ncbi:MAG: GH92 family glycosyl hydrolase, partial [Proteobacteria bacterium]|nr:GH92 family glycosyl hydrolase [Pseudomonadota bacterium]